MNCQIYATFVKIYRKKAQQTFSRDFQKILGEFSLNGEISKQITKRGEKYIQWAVVLYDYKATATSFY